MRPKPDQPTNQSDAGAQEDDNSATTVSALLEGFPIVKTIDVAWGEMDAFRHVNNTVFFRYFETARIAYLVRVGFERGPEAGAIGSILARTECRFRRPLTFPDTVDVGARATDVGIDRFTMEYRIVSRRLGEVAATGSGVVVSFDYARGEKTPIPDEVRQRITLLEGGA